MAQTTEHEADTVEQATAHALTALGASRDTVEVEILDSGSKGFMGIGGRQARVRVTKREQDTMDTHEHTEQAETTDDILDTEAEAVAEEITDETPEAEEAVNGEAEAEAEAPAAPPKRKRRRLDGRDGVPARSRRPRRVKRDAAPEAKPEAPEEPVRPAKPVRAEEPAEQDEVRETESTEERRPSRNRRPERGRDREERRPAKKRRERPARTEREAPADDSIVRDPEEVVADLLGFMGFDADVAAVDREEAVQVDIDCDDTNLLIGKHGQNIDSLQYIASRICNFGRNDPFPMLIDVADYRAQREETLENLAFSLADKVVRTGRPISLEPLPAMERRIIHLALKNDEDVETYSRGEADERYVVIGPKRGRGRGRR